MIQGGAKTWAAATWAAATWDLGGGDLVGSDNWPAFYFPLHRLMPLWQPLSAAFVLHLRLIFQLLLVFNLMLMPLIIHFARAIKCAMQQLGLQL